MFVIFNCMCVSVCVREECTVGDQLQVLPGFIGDHSDTWQMREHNNM